MNVRVICPFIHLHYDRRLYMITFTQEIPAHIYNLSHFIFYRTGSDAERT